MNVLEQLRLAQVKRYPICHVNRDQSVAEHSYNVLLISIELAREARDADITEAVIEYAIHHDMEEIYTGDIPSSFKRQMRAQCPAVAPLIDSRMSMPDEVKGIVKLADYLEAIHYLREYGGSRQAELVLADIYDNFVHELANSKAPVAVVAKARALGNLI